MDTLLLSVISSMEDSFILTIEQIIDWEVRETDLNK